MTDPRTISLQPQATTFTTGSGLEVTQHIEVRRTEKPVLVSLTRVRSDGRRYARLLLTEAEADELRWALTDLLNP